MRKNILQSDETKNRNLWTELQSLRLANNRAPLITWIILLLQGQHHAVGEEGGRLSKLQGQGIKSKPREGLIQLKTERFRIKTCSRVHEFRKSRLKPHRTSASRPEDGSSQTFPVQNDGV